MSPERQARFLAALGATWSVTDAARAIGVCSHTPYRWRKRDKAFAEAWDETLARGADAAGDGEARRGPEGCLDPALDQGAESAAVRATDNRLLMCLLKAHRPERYKGRNGHEHETKQSKKGAPDGVAGRARRRSPGD